MADTSTTTIKEYLKRNLTAVLKKQNAETKEQIAAAVAGADHLKRKVVTGTDAITLTASDADQYIYMVPVTDGPDNNKYNEYMVIDGALELVGSTSVDLTGYAKTEDVNAAISDATKDDVKLTALSAETTGTGNVVTAVSYDAASGKTTAAKGITALTSDDLTDFTDDEVAGIIADAKKTDSAG